MDGAAARTLGRVAANNIELAYETFGDASGSPVVLIMGLATQMIAWPDELCEGLAQCGLFVIRFDNRDVGESTHLRHLPAPRLADVVVRRRPPPYSISDMAGDVAGLIGGLGLGQVHLVGASMGGFIAQAVALGHADRVRTLTLMMTSTGSRRVGQPKPRVYARLLRPPGAADRSAAMAAAVETFRLIGSPGFAFDEAYVRDIAGRSWDRGYDPAGRRRQLAASAGQHDRTAELRRLTIPTLVIHGLHDPLVAPSGGLAIAKAIPDSRFVGFSGMGHDLPRALWPEFVREIAAMTALGDQRGRQGAPAGYPKGGRGRLQRMTARCPSGWHDPPAPDVRRSPRLRPPAAPAPPASEEAGISSPNSIAGCVAPFPSPRKLPPWVTSVTLGIGASDYNGDVVTQLTMAPCRFGHSGL